MGKHKIIIAGLLAALPAFASAAIDGNFLAACRKDQINGLDDCRAYVVGVMDGIAYSSIANNTPIPYCAPPGVSGAQARDIAIDYARKHPEHRHHPAHVIIPVSLAKVFPC